MVELLGLALGVGLALLTALFHVSTGPERTTPEDIAGEVLERRAATVEETDFAEPMNRAVGGGGGAAAVPAGAEAEGELDEAEEETEGFDPSAVEEEEEFDIEFEKEGETVPVANTETLLDAGEDEGWDLPFACREGQCLSCAGRIDGDATEHIQHSNNEVLSEEEMEKGYCLTCVAYPTDEFSIETSEAP